MDGPQISIDVWGLLEIYGINKAYNDRRMMLSINEVYDAVECQVKGNLRFAAFLPS
jgi:hypothetical protein